MKTRLVCTVIAVLVAVLAAASAVLAKDDPAARKALEEEIRKELKAAGKIATWDLAYVVDTKKLQDPRWEARPVKAPESPDQGRMLSVDLQTGNTADATPAVRLRISKCIHENSTTDKEFSRSFKAIGERVKVSDVKRLAEASYEDWMKEAVEPSTDQCRKPSKRDVGALKAFFGYAVATGSDLVDENVKLRCRRDWYLWTRSEKVGMYTWTATAQIPDKRVKEEVWAEKLEDFMKNLKPFEDDRLK
jgi:hypothetical protein